MTMTRASLLPWRATLATLCLSLPCLTAWAGLLAYEPFDYAASANIAALSAGGGTGWYAGTTWANGASAIDNCTVRPEGLTYVNPGGPTFKARGRALGLESSSADLRLARQLAQTIGATPQTCWVSFLLQDLDGAAVTDGGAYLVLNADGDPGPWDNGIFIGKKWSGKKFVNRPYAFTANTSDLAPNPYLTNTTYLLLGRVILTQTNAQPYGVHAGDVTWWSYQSGVDLLPTAPPAGGTQRTGTAASLRAFPYVTFMNEINNGGYCRCAFDEVRIADTFNDAMGWAHEPPATPVNLAPLNGALNVSVTPTLIISNYADVDGDAQVASQWQIARTRDFSTPAWDSGATAGALTTNTVPAGVLASNTLYYWHARVQDSSNEWSAWSSPTFFVTPQDMTITNGITLLVYDTEGATLAMLAAQGYALTLWSGGPDPARLLCIGRETLSGGGSLPGSLDQFVSNGGRALLFTQNPDWLRTTLGLRVARHVTRRVFPLDPRHPVVAGLDAEDLRDWRGESTLLAHHDEYSPEAGKVTYGWRWGCNGAVSSAAIEKPHRAGWRPLLECEFDLAYAPLLELDYGNGHVLLGTLDLEDHYARDPAARILLRQLVEYARTNAYVARTSVVYHGDATGALLVTNTLGVTCAIGANTALTPAAGLHLIGAGVSISDMDLRTYLTGGGRVVFLPRTATGVQHLGLTLGAQSNYAGSLNPPTNWYEARGLSASDLRFRTSTNVVLVTGGGWEIGADGQLARTNIGAGVAIWCQMDPNRFNHTVTTFFRFTRWRQIRALAQVMANLGAPFADDGAVLRQISGSYYDPDYRTDFELGDDPYRYYRW